MSGPALASAFGIRSVPHHSSLVAPNPLAMLAAGTLLLALELEARVVGEPYLLAAHGGRYAAYAARVGRFAPGLRLLRSAGG